MTIATFPTSMELARAVAGHVAHWVRAHPGGLLCLAAGDTPLAAYRLLAAEHRTGAIDLNTMWYVGLDEWVGLGRRHTGSCRQVMADGFYDLAGIDPARILAFDGENGDLAGQCAAVDRWIDGHGGIGLTVLGIGRNGHVGFNEPGTSPTARSHIVELDATTRLVGQKYFVDGVVPGRGVTVGMGQLLAAEELLLVASGAHKASIVRQALAGAPTPGVPASLLRRNDRLTVWLDEEAAREL